MKKLLFVFCFFIPFAASATAKADTATRLDSISTWGTALNTGWKFHAGDNQSWADTAYDDSKWPSIDPSQPISYLSQVREAQIGWFRLKLFVGKELRDKTFAFSISQTGASEIYLDGKMIKQYGRVSADHSRERIYDPAGQPLTFQFDDKPAHVIAVRYSYTRQNIYLGDGQSAFLLYLGPTDRLWSYYDNLFDYYIHRAFTLGVFVILCLLHLAIYLGYRKRKINLLFIPV